MWIYENCHNNNNKPYCKSDQKGHTDVHIDDFIQITHDEYECIEMGDNLLNCFDEHGIRWDPKKTQRNVRKFKHHGAIWDLINLFVSVPQPKIDWVIKAIEFVIKYKYASVRFWYKLSGKLMYFASFYKPTKALIANLIWYIYKLIFNNNLNKDDLILINEVIIADLLYWKQYCKYLTNIPIKYLLKNYNFSFVFSTDASSTGLGIYFQGYYIFYKIPANIMHWHINEKEVFAILVGLNTFKKQMANLQGRCYVDNMTAKAVFANKWSTNPRIMQCLYFSCLIMLEYKILIYVDYITTHLNCIADSLSRFEIQRFYNLCNKYSLPYNKFSTQPLINFDFSYAEFLFQNKLHL